MCVFYFRMRDYVIGRIFFGRVVDPHLCLGSGGGYFRGGDAVPSHSLVLCSKKFSDNRLLLDFFVIRNFNSFRNRLNKVEPL